MGGNMETPVVVLTELSKDFSTNKGRKFMRTCCAFLLIGFGLMTVDAQAQGSTTPAKINVVYYVQGESLTELPRLSGKKKTSLLITARSKIRMELQGKTSDIKVEEDSKPTFMAILPSGETTRLLLFPLRVSGSKREAVVGTGGGLHGESGGGAETLPLDFVKQGSDSYRITSSAALKPGEYAFAFAGSNEFFCFTLR
jgi:hypothetical protein